MKTLRFDISAKDPGSALIEPVSNLSRTTPTQPPQFRNGSETIRIEAIDSQNLGALQDLSSYTVEFAIGNLNGSPTAGQVVIGDSIASDTATISYNTTAAELQTSLNAMNSAAGPENGTVTVTGVEGIYRIRWNANGSRTLLATEANSNTFTPSSGATILEEITGDGSTQEVQVIHIQQSPAVFNDSWASVSTGLQAEVNFNTFQFLFLLGANESVTTDMEIRVKNGTENVARLQMACTIHGSVIDLNTITNVSLPDHYTKAEADLNFIHNQSGITGLTGGGATNLDGIVTASSATAVNTLIGIESTSGMIDMWRLESGTDAEDAANGIVRPDDYAASTNEVVWKLKAITADKTDSGQTTITGAGNTDITPAAGKAVHTEFITITDTGTSGATGDFDVTVSLVSTNSTNGDVVNLRFASTLPMDETVKVYDASTGGTLLTTFPNIDASSGTQEYQGSYVFDSTSGEFREVSASFL